MIDETPLKAILSLARTGRLQDSARALGVSNATLSRIIQRAEEELGMVLFTRGRLGFTLTGNGRAFLPLAERLLDDLGRFHNKADALVDGGGARLVIGCGPLATRTIVAPILSEMMSDMPDLQSQITVGAAEEPIAQLERGELDIFVGDLTHTPWTDQIEIQVLDKRPVVFVAGRNHPLHRDGPHHLADVLREYPLGSPFLHKHWQAALSSMLDDDAAEGGKTRRLPQVQCDDYAFLAALCQTSTMVVGGMAETFAEHVAQGDLRPIRLHRTMTWNICIARRLGARSLAEDRFWDAVIARDCRTHGTAFAL